MQCGIDIPRNRVRLKREQQEGGEQYRESPIDKDEFPAPDDGQHKRDRREYGKGLKDRNRGVDIRVGEDDEGRHVKEDLGPVDEVACRGEGDETQYQHPHETTGEEHPGRDDHGGREGRERRDPPEADFPTV